MNEKDTLEKLKEKIVIKHYLIKTFKAYSSHIKKYIRFLRKTNSLVSSSPENKIEAFLTHITKKGNVSASTQNQAMNALVFLYKIVFQVELSGSIDAVRAKKAKRLPVVLTKEEVRLILSEISGVNGLMASLLYACGLRLKEVLCLRIKDIDFGQGYLIIREGKGNKDRVPMLPKKLEASLRAQIDRVSNQHDLDIKKGFGQVDLPSALAYKYPHANKELLWQYVFPSKNIIKSYEGVMIRHHAHEDNLPRAVKRAAKRARILKRVTCHVFRHSFATHLLETGYDIRTVQELLGHKDVSTTMVYTHVMQKKCSIQSPYDCLVDS